MPEVFTLSVECRLSASHVLPDCPPCDRLHGHTWTVRAFWMFHTLDAHGMGSNFRDLRKALHESIHERYDHRHLNDVEPFDRIAPTAENLAREAYRALDRAVDTGDRGWLGRVEVWEGPESCVAYSRPPGEETAR